MSQRRLLWQLNADPSVDLVAWADALIATSEVVDGTCQRAKFMADDKRLAIV